MNKAIVAAIAILLFLLFQTSPRAQAITDFYKGKNVTFIVGTAAGGDYDAWSHPRRRG